MHQILLSEQLYGLHPVKHLRLLNRLPPTDQDNGQFHLPELLRINRTGLS